MSRKERESGSGRVGCGGLKQVGARWELKCSAEVWEGAAPCSFWIESMV